jgi:hypothetical protein
MALAVQTKCRGTRVMSGYDSKQGANLLGMATGAAVGALAIYILRTPRGRGLLEAAIDLLDEFSFECARFRQACIRAQFAMSDSWQAVKGSTMSSTGGGRETVF